MTSSTHRDSALEKLCKTAIAQRLGDVSGLPQDLKEYVLKIYRKFIASYLNTLRQSEKKPADWMPETLSIDEELADGMRHFFSDYQHIARAFYTLNQKMDRLQQIDKDSQPNLYRHTIDDIMGRDRPSDLPGDEYEDAR